MKTEKKINMPCIFIRYFLFYFFNNLVPKDTISLCVKKKSIQGYVMMKENEINKDQNVEFFFMVFSLFLLSLNHITNPSI